MAHSVTSESSQANCLFPPPAKPPRRNQQGITRQKEANKHSSLDENNDANHQRAAPGEQAANVVEACENFLQEFDHLSNFQISSGFKKTKPVVRGSNYNSRNASQARLDAVVLSSYKL